VLEAREALEVKLAELAAARRSPEDLHAMRGALRTMEEEIRTGGLGLVGDADFHHAIAVAAHNKVLGHLIDEIALAIQESRVESLSEPGRPAPVAEGPRADPGGHRCQEPRARGASDADAPQGSG